MHSSPKNVSSLAVEDIDVVVIVLGCCIVILLLEVVVGETYRRKLAFCRGEWKVGVMVVCDTNDVQ